MSDLYERLLAEVELYRDAYAHGDELGDMHEAVGAVLELHKPVKSGTPLGQSFTACDECGHEDDGFGYADDDGYPCDTVRAVARALDVPIGDQQ